jgi:hypothetical protein
MKERDTSHDKAILTGLIKKVKEEPSATSLHVFFLFLNKLEFMVPVHVCSTEKDGPLTPENMRLFCAYVKKDYKEDVLPVFFEENNMPDDYKKQVGFVKLKLKDLFKYIGQNEKAVGFVINPFSDLQLVTGKMYDTLKEVYETEMKEDTE